MVFTAPLTWVVGQLVDEDDLNLHLRDQLRFLKGLDGLIDLSSAMEIDNAISYLSEIDDGNSGTADTIDWTAGQKHKSTLTDDVTYTFTAPNGIAGGLVLRLVQDPTGTRLATWPATVKWPDGVPPVLTTAANAIDLAVFYFDGTDYYGAAFLDMK